MDKCCLCDKPAVDFDGCSGIAEVGGGLCQEHSDKKVKLMRQRAAEAKRGLYDPHKYDYLNGEY